MSGTILYLCIVRLDGVERVLSWESYDGTPDQVTLDDEGMILAFPSEQIARNAHQLTGRLVSADAPAIYDFDATLDWCKSDAEVRDCRPILDIWNLLSDLPHDRNLFAGSDGHANDVYEKLFFGCNLPAITPPGEQYEPTWSRSETAEIKRLLILGLAEFRARLRW
jgi:hypothetical protein